MMVPMRRALIVKEHGQLPYPEGTACAEVLIAGERGGQMARTVFAGFWTAMAYSFANKLFALWREVPRLIATGPTHAWKNATLTSEITPEYLGVGYIIGPRIAGSWCRAACCPGSPSRHCCRCSCPRRPSRPT
jgi:uncharacterized oligopeptide transporter (OPT) family protein